jgi:hypothetical protein
VLPDIIDSMGPAGSKVGVWRRQMVLGPSPEFAVIAPADASSPVVPEGWTSLAVDRRKLEQQWEDLRHAKLRTTSARISTYLRDAHRRHTGGLAQLKPKVWAAMHGSTFVGDGKRAVTDVAIMVREVLGWADGRA